MAAGCISFGNMLFLWIFGDNVEDRLGHLKFLVFYLLAGIAATLSQYAIAPESGVPNVGASGAIAGVLGAYILMFPQARVNVLLGRQIVAMPAFAVLGLWIVLQLVSGVGTIAYTDESAGGIAYMAHIGGFGAGLLMAFLLRGSRQFRHHDLTGRSPLHAEKIALADLDAETPDDVVGGRGVEIEVRQHEMHEIGLALEVDVLPAER